MAAPTFVSAGTQDDESFGNTLTPGLPGSLANGNILIGVAVSGVSGAAKTFSWPAPWQEIDFHSSTDASASIAWREVDGTEVVPTVGYGPGFTSAIAQLFQYAGALLTGGGPFGNMSKAFNVGAGTQWAHGPLATSRPGSLGVALVGGSSNMMVGTPSGWTTNNGGAGGIGGCTGAFSVDMTVQGSTPAISSGFVTTPDWASFLLELVSEEEPSETSEPPSEESSEGSEPPSDEPSEESSESSEEPSEPPSEDSSESSEEPSEPPSEDSSESSEEPSEPPSEPPSEEPSEDSSETSEEPSETSEEPPSEEPSETSEEPEPLPPPIQCVVVCI